MNMKKENIKTKIYLTLYIIFTILTFIGAGYVIYNKGQVNAGYSVIPMLFGLVFARLYRESKKK